MVTQLQPLLLLSSIMQCAEVAGTCKTKLQNSSLLTITTLLTVCHQDMQDDAEPPLDRQLVVYNPPQFLQPLQEREKRVEFGGREWVIKQDWEGVGVASVIWEPVFFICHSQCKCIFHSF